MLGALLFVLGFSVVFIAVAVTVSAAGALLKATPGSTGACGRTAASMSTRTIR
jgi:cytochrome c biogenesis protein CcdA